MDDITSPLNNFKTRLQSVEQDFLDKRDMTNALTVTFLKEYQQELTKENKKIHFSNYKAPQQIKRSSSWESLSWKRRNIYFLLPKSVRSSRRG